MYTIVHGASVERVLDAQFPPDRGCQLAYNFLGVEGKANVSIG